jgi:hypothetical protein
VHWSETSETDKVKRSNWSETSETAKLTGAHWSQTSETAKVTGAHWSQTSETETCAEKQHILSLLPLTYFVGRNSWFN